MSDAIMRTLVRVYVTHRHLLEWVTAAQAKSGLGLDFWGFYRRMAGGLALALCAAAIVGWRRPDVLGSVVPFLLLWMASLRWRGGSARLGSPPGPRRCPRPTRGPSD